MNKENFKLIPKVDDLINHNEIRQLLETIPRKIIIDSIREELESLRAKVKKNISKEDLHLALKDLIKNIKDNASRKNEFSLRRTINCTGVILHTNLGRALLNEEIMDNLKMVASNYSNLEYDIEGGTRGSRYSHLEDKINAYLGCEASMVVNNNAAAVMLVLSTMASQREVIVSRGELIEIGGSFRIPDVMKFSSATLKEVGTTNKTHLFDYEDAISDETAAIMKIHTSNYRILGFTENVDSGELVSLKERYNIPIIEDLGSGVLIDLSKYGLEYEPTVQESLKKGVDIVTFSGDKLLGGPQCGIIVGKKAYIDKMKKNPLTRVLRVDKLAIAALESTLKYYLDEEIAIEKIPTLKMLTMNMETISKKASILKSKIDKKILDKNLKIEIEDDYSQVGGGSMPLEKIPTKCIVIHSKEYSTEKFEGFLRKFKVPIIARLYRDKIYFDVRTIKDNELDLVAEGIEFALDMLKEC